MSLMWACYERFHEWGSTWLGGKVQPVSVSIMMQEEPLAEVASLQAQRQMFEWEDLYERQTAAHYSHSSGHDGGGKVSGHWGESKEPCHTWESLSWRVQWKAHDGFTLEMAVTTSLHYAVPRMRWTSDMVWQISALEYASRLTYNK